MFLLVFLLGPLMESECTIEKPGYKWISGKCYFFDSTYRKFENATDNCATKFKFGGKLVEPRSLQVIDSVYEASKNVLDGSSYYYWLGIGYSEAMNIV